MNRHQFLAEFVYGVEKYFDIGGIQASWAKGSKPAHRFWGDEDDRIEIPYTSDEHTTSDFAVSPDEKLVAVCGGLLISVYDIATKECHTQFRCPDESFPKLRFHDLARGDGGFCLIVATSDRPAMNNKLVMVELDNDGHMLTGQANILITPNLIDQSLAPIVSRVNCVYVTPNTVPRPLLDEVRAKYTRALEHLQAKLLFESFKQIDGRFSASQTSSKDGRLLLYTINNHTTQRVSRPVEELPKVVVYDFINKSQKQVLSGHEDLVTWTSFSPDNSHIASASWDGTYRIFDSTTGDCKHIIGPIGGQCSSGAWSPDSAHIIVRGNGRRASEDTGAIESYSLVAVYSAMTGEEVTQFKHRDSRSRSGQIAWSSRDEIAISHETDIWIWKPFEDKVISSFSLSAGNSMLKAFARFNKISWAKDGQLLIVMSGDSTIEVWDRVLNVKWTLQRPQGLTTKRHGQSFIWLERHQRLMCLNSDGFLRFYNLD